MNQVSYRATFTDATRPAAGADRVGTLAWKHEVLLPEDVKAAFEVASPFTRVIAFLFDVMVISVGGLVIILLAIMLFAATGMVASPLVTLALMIILLVALNMGYFPIFEALFAGQTPGKYVMKLRVIGEDGEEINARQAVIRSFMRFAIIGPLPGALMFAVFMESMAEAIDFFMAIAPFSALGAWMFIDRKCRGIPDLVANTMVIEQKFASQAWNTPYVPLYFHLPHHFFPLNASEMSKLTPEDYVKLEEFGTRLSTVSSEARQQAAMAAAAALATRMGYSKPVDPEYAEIFLFEMHSALKQQLQQLYPDLYA